LAIIGAALAITGTDDDASKPSSPQRIRGRLAAVIGRAVNLASPFTVEYLGGALMIDLSGEHRAPDPALLRRLREEVRRARDDERGER
jgi:hypothetical protein